MNTNKFDKTDINKNKEIYKYVANEGKEIILYNDGDIAITFNFPSNQFQAYIWSKGAKGYRWDIMETYKKNIPANSLEEYLDAIVNDARKFINK